MARRDTMLRSPASCTLAGGCQADNSVSRWSRRGQPARPVPAAAARRLRQSPADDLRSRCRLRRTNAQRVPQQYHLITLVERRRFPRTYGAAQCARAITPYHGCGAVARRARAAWRCWAITLAVCGALWSAVIVYCGPPRRCGRCGAACTPMRAAAALRAMWRSVHAAGPACFVCAVLTPLALLCCSFVGAGSAAMRHLAAAILAAVLLLAAQGIDGITLSPPPVLGSTYVYSYVSGGVTPRYLHGNPLPIRDGTLRNATFNGYVGSGFATRIAGIYQWNYKPRAVVDSSSRLWFLNYDYLRVMDFAADSVTTVYPATHSTRTANILNCNDASQDSCGAVNICGADAGWTTLYIGAWTADPADPSNTQTPYAIIALNLATWAYTVIPIPQHPWDCVVNATSPTSGTIYISVNGGIQTLNLATHVVSDLTLVLPADPYSYVPGTNFADGPLASAAFGPFNSLALGDGAQLYRADAMNYCIRRLDTAARTVVTISGDPTIIYPNTPPVLISDTCGTTTLAPVAVASASWSRPMSVVWDSARQRLYVVCALVM